MKLPHRDGKLLPLTLRFKIIKRAQSLACLDDGNENRVHEPSVGFGESKQIEGIRETSRRQPSGDVGGIIEYPINHLYIGTLILEYLDHFIHQRGYLGIDSCVPQVRAVCDGEAPHSIS